MSVTQAGSNWDQTGSISPAFSRRRGQTRRCRCGFHPQGTIWRAEHIYGMRTLVRIQPWWWRGQGVAGVAPATSSVAARAVKLHAVATVLESKNEKGEEVAGLTAITTRQTARSGTSWCGGDGEGDLRRRSVKTWSKKTK